MSRFCFSHSQSRTLQIRLNWSPYHYFMTVRIFIELVRATCLREITSTVLVSYVNVPGSTGSEKEELVGETG